MKILVSFVNTTHSSKYYNKVGLSQLALLDTRSDRIYFVDTKNIDDNGFSGLVSDNKYIYCVTQSKDATSVVKVKISNLKIVKKLKTQKVVDPHSILSSGNHLYIVSTGTNSVELFNKSLKYIKTYWRHPDTRKARDEVHVNSIFKQKGNILVSCFGRKSKTRWSSAIDGYIINTETNDKLISGVNHPHSATSYKDDIYYCESSLGKVYVNKDLLFMQKGSYLRGLAMTDKFIVVGVSGGRKSSKSTKTILNPIERGKYISKTGIVIFNRKYSKTRYYDLSFVEKEIYDILIIEEDNFNFDLGIVGMSVIGSGIKIKENLFISELLSKNEILEGHTKYLESKLDDIKGSIFYKPFYILNKLENRIIK